MPQNIPIPSGGSFPANLIAITDGDSLNSVNFAAVEDEVAAAVGYLKDKTDGPSADGGTLPQANHTILQAELTGGKTYFKIPAILASYEYTLPAGIDGQTVAFRLNPPGGAFTITIRRPDTTAIAVMDGDLGGSPVQQHLEATRLSGVWVVTGFGVNDSPSYDLG